ncbi:hypothetical protein RRG08_023355 [Elysia crispata]|uniref:Uncharacterized protein n=1 Tax=Elysia crispata TaxID=231223 RepID=A0AAE1EDI5_9GAST|nr:hypothetical protein RRG08_023355 [Elysia crispata]
MDTAENPGGHCDGHRSRPILAKSGILPSSSGDTDSQSSHTVCTHQPPPITISSTQVPLVTQTLEDMSLVSGCSMQTKAFQMKLLTSSCHHGDLKQSVRHLHSQGARVSS